MQKPLLKQIFSDFYLENNVLHIITGNNDLEIDDPTEDIYKLLKLLDGTKSINDLNKLTLLDVEIITDFIESLEQLGLIEDGAYESSLLNENEIKKYHVNLNYFSSIANNGENSISYQEKLKKSTVLILGLGGYSLIAASLAGMGIGKIIGIDFDLVEESNLNRQIMFDLKDIGKLKTEAIKEKIVNLNDAVKTDFINIKVSSSSSIIKYIQEADYVIDGIDQPGIISSRWVNNCCVDQKKPYFHGGIRNNKIQFFKYFPDNACYDCMLLEMLSEEKSSSMLNHYYGASFHGLNTAVPHNLCLLSSVAISECIKYILDVQSGIKSNTLYEISDSDYSIKEKETWLKKAHCPTCNTNHFSEPVSFKHLSEIGYRK